MSMNIALDPTELANLPVIERPEEMDLAILHGEPSHEDESTVFFHQSALQSANDHALSDLRNEVGGFLLGHAYMIDDQTVVEIVEAIPAENRDHGPVHFTLTADSWAMAHKIREADYPDLQIVGWFHTHPNLGVFFSADDRIVQRTAFTLPWQVGLVIDPIRNEASCFGWQFETGEIEALSGFSEIRDESQFSVISWRVVSNTGLAGWWSRMTGDAEYAPSDGIYQMESEPFDAAFRRGLFAGIVSFLVSLVVVSAILIPMGRQNNRLEQSLVVLLQEQQLELHESAGLSCPTPDLFMTQPAIGQRFTVGDTILFEGVAADDAAARYQIEARRLGDTADAPASTWQVVETRRFDQSFGQIGRWSTNNLPPGTYEIRLLSLASSGEPNLNGACHTTIQLVDSSS